MPPDALFREAVPRTPTRAVHLDLKGLPPTPQRLDGLLKIIAAAGYNAVLVEWEDMFPWTVDERFRCETAYTPEQVRQFAAAAAERGIEIIPLIETLGHMQTPLSLPGYEALREVPHQTDVLNPLADGAAQLVHDMIEDVLALLPDCRRFHLGGDEAGSLGSSPAGRDFVAQHGRAGLYLHHYEPILEGLNARGIRPILWHDMMVDWDDAALRRLGEKADLCTWGYHGHPDDSRHHFNSRHVARFAKLGVTLWGGTAYKGADGRDADRPDLAARQANALGWAELADRHGFTGLIATAWSRYSTNAPQCEPIDGCLDALLAVGVILHDHAPAAGGLDACVAALDALGEREHFEACKAALERLAAARAAAWNWTRHLRQQLVVSSLDRRRAPGNEIRQLRELRRAVEEAEQAGEQLRTALGGCIEPIWIERYLGERIEPLREECEYLICRVRQTNPAGLQAL